MMTKSVGWTMGGLSGQPDPMEFDINLRPDEVVVKIDMREDNRAGTDQNASSEDPRYEPQEPCRGVRGHVVEAGADALWYVDRSVVIPAAGSRCENCNSGPRRGSGTHAGQEITEIHADKTPGRFVVIPAHRLCVVSVAVDWRKPT